MATKIAIILTPEQYATMDIEFVKLKNEIQKMNFKSNEERRNAWQMVDAIHGTIKLNYYTYNGDTPQP